jgi:hypothetical protein
MMMASRAQTLPTPATGSGGFFLWSAVVMTFVIIAGFSLQFAMGRSSFAAPPLVHAHAIVFMGWVGIYLAQNVFVATGNIAMHRRLGWIAAGWTALMVILGVAVTLALVRAGRVPFFFRPQQFLVFDPLTLFAFVGLTVAAIRLRRTTDWHRRLHFCAMTMMLGPALGRLLPVPLLIPWAFEATFAATMLFPAAGVIADWRRDGRVHPAWWWGIGVVVATLVLVEVVTYSPVGDALYAALTADTPGAVVPGRDFPPPPPF